MNVFSRIKDAFTRVKSKLFSEKAAQTSQQQKKDQHRRRSTTSGHYHKLIERFRFTRFRTGKIFGPVFLVPREDHHVSRQTCRAYLRNIFFAQLSKDFPTASRQQRRRIARLQTSLEYRQMMRDKTNQVSEFDEAVSVA